MSPCGQARIKGVPGARRLSVGVGVGLGTMKENYTAYIGEREVWGQSQAFGIDAADRRHHIYAIGKTGSGKTTLLRNLIVQDIEAGRGVGVIDPHGDLAEELLDYIPPFRSDDVVYLNAADLDYPIGFNLLADVALDRRHLVASGVVSVLKSIWRDSWGPRLEYVLYNAVATLLDNEHATLLGLPRLLVDENYREKLVKKVKDPLIQGFWRNEYARYDRQFRQEMIAPIQNKIGRFLMNAPIRNMVGQVKSKIDLRFMMDDGRILIANLAKGRLGEDKANLLGSLLVGQFQFAAMSRADQREEERRDFSLFIDEFHNFTTDSFASILSESRKYGLCLTLSHQYSDQVSTDIQSAVFGNVGTLIAFHVGNRDAAVLEAELGLRAGLFTELRRHETVVRRLMGGEGEEPFLARTLAPLGRKYGRRENLIGRSREKYGRPRSIVEEKIARWLKGM